MIAILEQRKDRLKKLLAEKKVFGYIDMMGKGVPCTNYSDLETLYVFGGMTLLLIQE